MMASKGVFQPSFFAGVLFDRYAAVSYIHGHKNEGRFACRRIARAFIVRMLPWSSEWPFCSGVCGEDVSKVMPFEARNSLNFFPSDRLPFERKNATLRSYRVLTSKMVLMQISVASDLLR